MRILQIAAYFYPSYRGTEQTVAYLGEALEQRGHQVDILTVNTEGAPKQELWGSGIGVYRCAPTLRYRRAVLSLELGSRLMKARDYDIYHIHIPFQTGLEMAILASKVNRIPLVANHHGEGPRVGLVHGISRDLYNLLYRRVDLHYVERVIFFTRSYPDSLSLSQGIRQRVRAIRPAVDTAMFRPREEQASLREGYNLGVKDKVVLFVSGLSFRDRRRRGEHLIEAVAMVREQIPEVRLVIIGEGELLPGLKDLAHKLQLDSEVIFAGRVTGEELALHYAMCDVFAFPSTYESFGYAVLEAMASGKPSIVCDIPGVGEIVRHGETGLKVPPDDVKALAEAIAFLLKDNGLQQKMGERARKEVESRSWRDVAEEVVKVYNEVVTR